MRNQTPGSVCSIQGRTGEDARTAIATIVASISGSIRATGNSGSGSTPMGILLFSLPRSWITRWVRRLQRKTRISKEEHAKRLT